MMPFNIRYVQCPSGERAAFSPAENSTRPAKAAP
jgi:hypothetical protein